MIQGNHEVAAPAEAPGTRTVSGWSVAGWACLLLAPVAAWWAFGLVLINQDQFVDPWFYTGYGRIFRVLHEMFGWPYYAVRFPVIMLNGVFLSGDDPLIGYAILRYLLVLLCGIPLYAWSRRTFGRSAAIVGYLFLFCNPIFPRVVLWDLTTFVSVPMAVAGMMAWFLSDRMAGRFAAGFLMMASVASHAFTGTAVATFLVVQAVRRIRSREFRALMLRDVAMTASGAVACFALGCLYYYARVGAFDPRVLVTVTLDAIGAGQAYASDHRTAFSAWAAREYHVYVPFLCVAMSGVLLGRRLRDNTPVASIWWFGLVYSVIYLAYQFVLGAFVLETFYYFAHLTVVVFLLVPIIVAELGSIRGRRPTLLATIAPVAALVLLPLVHHFMPRVGVWLSSGYDRIAVLAAMVVIASITVASASRLARTAAAPAVLCVFLLCVQVLTFLSPIHRRVFDSAHRARETGVYRAAVQMLDVFAAHSTSAAPAMLWYCNTQHSAGSIASSALLFSLNSPWTADACRGELGEYELMQLALRPRYLLLLDERPASFGAQEASLRAVGYDVTERSTKVVGDDAYHAVLRLVAIDRPPR